MNAQTAEVLATVATIIGALMLGALPVAISAHREAAREEATFTARRLALTGGHAADRAQAVADGRYIPRHAATELDTSTRALAAETAAGNAALVGYVPETTGRHAADPRFDPALFNARSSDGMRVPVLAAS